MLTSYMNQWFTGLLAWANELVVLSLTQIPFGEYFSAPWDWFLEQEMWIQGVILIFGPLGFYLVLRLFYKIVESIMAMFQ